MRFSIQVQDEPKMFFHFLPAAEKATGLNQQTIGNVLERGNKVYHRQLDHKVYTISKEDPILIARIAGEEFFSLEKICEKFNLTKTKFLNQINRGKFAKKIDWISDELFPERAKQEEKIDELKILREEMEKMRSQFEEKLKSQMEEMAKMKSQLGEMEKMKAQLQKQQEEIEKLSSREASLHPLSPEVFQPKKPFFTYTFNLMNVAKFIRRGFVSEIQSVGPKTHRYVLIEGRREYLPVLVKQIIKEHIVPELEKETQETMKKRAKEYSESAKNGKLYGMTFADFCTLRRGLLELDPPLLADLVAKVMKMI